MIILLVAVSITMTVAQHETLKAGNVTVSKPVDKFISEAERQEYLQKLQDETTLTMIPAMVTLLLMAVIGIIGNSLVLHVYSRKFSINGTRVLILVVAAFDLVANVIVIPGEVYNMLHLWDFDQPWACRIRLYVTALTTLVSAQLLTALAVVRYRKVCVPFGWQISAGHAKVIALILVICSALASAPFGVLNGRKTWTTPRPEINGYECTIDDAYADTIWPLVNSIFFILIFLGNSSTIVVLYSIVGTQALRHSRAVRKGTSSGGPGSSDGAVTASSTSAGNFKSKDSGGDNQSDRDMAMSGEENTSFVKISKSQRTVTFSIKRDLKKEPTVNEDDKDTRAAKKSRVKEEKNTVWYVTDDEDSEISDDTRARKSRKMKNVKPKRRSLNRTTVMLIAISAVYIIGFLPYLSLTIYFTLYPDDKKALGFVGLSLYNLFARLFLLNCAANPVIYAICDLTFRNKCVSEIRNSLCCNRSS